MIFCFTIRIIGINSKLTRHSVLFFFLNITDRKKKSQWCIIILCDYQTRENVLLLNLKLNSTHKTNIFGILKTDYDNIFNMKTTLYLKLQNKVI